MLRPRQCTACPVPRRRPVACVAAGIASLWGPAHGGAIEACSRCWTKSATQELGAKDGQAMLVGFRPPRVEKLRSARQSRPEDLPRGACGTQAQGQQADRAGDGAGEDCASLGEVKWGACAGSRCCSAWLRRGRAASSAQSSAFCSCAGNQACRCACLRRRCRCLSAAAADVVLPQAADRFAESLCGTEGSVSPLEAATDRSVPVNEAGRQTSIRRRWSASFFSRSLLICGPRPRAPVLTAWCVLLSFTVSSA